MRPHEIDYMTVYTNNSVTISASYAIFFTKEEAWCNNIWGT